MTAGHDHASFKTPGGNRSGVLEPAPQDNTARNSSIDFEQQGPDTDGENQSDVDKPVEPAPPDDPAPRTSKDLEQQGPETDGENQSVVDEPVESAPPDNPAPRTSTDSALSAQTRGISTQTTSTFSTLWPEEETKERELTEDTFSFLFVTKPWPLTWENCPVLVVAVGIWFLQMAIYLIVLLSSFESKGSNKLDFPPNVDIPTRIAEVRRLLQSIHRRFTAP
jgi:hypothetical protein